MINIPKPKLNMEISVEEIIPRLFDSPRLIGICADVGRYRDWEADRKSVV